MHPTLTPPLMHPYTPSSLSCFQSPSYICKHLPLPTSPSHLHPPPHTLFPHLPSIPSSPSHSHHTLTFSRNQSGANPLPSCSTITLLSSPTSRHKRDVISTDPRSKLQPCKGVRQEGQTAGHQHNVIMYVYLQVCFWRAAIASPEGEEDISVSASSPHIPCVHLQ